MSLTPELRSSLVLPAICAPMMLVSGPELVTAACKAGLMAGLPRHNARSVEAFGAWLGEIRDSLAAHRDTQPDAVIGPLAVNMTLKRPVSELIGEIDLCVAHGVKYFITALGNPAELTKVIHDRGGVVYHDVTSLRFAEKAIAAGVDGVVCIGSGGGGHSGALNPLAFVPKVRAMFDGVVVFAGCVSDGGAIRAAEVLGADLVYLGTRFIATKEADAPEAYKTMLVESSADDLSYSPQITGVPANWLNPSLARAGVTLKDLPPASPDYAHLPEQVRPWRDLWSAGHGVELIADVPEVSTLVRRLRREYVAACRKPDMIAAAELADAAGPTADA